MKCILSIDVTFRRLHKNHEDREERRERKRINSVERTDASDSSDFHPPRRKSPPVGRLDIKLFNMARIVRFDAFPADFPEDIKFASEMLPLGTLVCRGQTPFFKGFTLTLRPSILTFSSLSPAVAYLYYYIPSTFISPQTHKQDTTFYIPIKFLSH